MKNYKDIEQGTIEWLEMRWGKVGGSTSAGLYNDSESLFLDILSQNLEDFEIDESYSSRDMERGKELEPFALEYLSSYYKVSFLTTGWLQCGKNRLLGISPDGLSKSETIACEIKCLGRKAHTNVLLNNEVPDEYIPQIVHYFTINPKLKKLYFICFRPESPKHFTKVFDRDSLVKIGMKKTTEDRPNPQGKMYSYVVTVPDVRKISEWSTVAREKADILLKRVEASINQLNQI